MKTFDASKPHGTKQLGDAAWVDFWVFPAGVDRLDAQLDTLVEDLRDLAGFGGPGMPYMRRPVVRRTAARVLVTQRGGIDI